MLRSQLLKPQPLLSWRACTKLYHSRRPQGPHNEDQKKDQTPQLSSQRPSLLEELFPEETSTKEADSQGRDQDVPRLPLPEIDRFFEESQDDFGRGKEHPKRVTSTAAAEAFKRQQIAVVSLQMASKSLVESDFRRIAPKGKHIDDWTGPGDILKVIPQRDPRTLEQTGQYFILFPNPAYARAYQSHVIHLHRVAKTHTPTSIESPLPMQPGVLVEGENVHDLFKDYALYPPSQRIQLKILDPPYAPSIKSTLQERGYRQLVEGDAKAGRSVLFWVQGQQLTTPMIKNTIAADGRDRGLAWNVSVDRVEATPNARDEERDLDVSDDDGNAELKGQRQAPQRWILSFPDENEARMFIRTWHRKQFPLAKGDGPKLVQTEFLW